jgi:hypothetical protein
MPARVAIFLIPQKSGIISAQTSTAVVLLSRLKPLSVSLFHRGKSYRLHRTRHHQVSNKFTGCEPKGNPANAGFFIDVVNVWTLEEINPFISVYYVQKISLRKGDYAG